MFKRSVGDGTRQVTIIAINHDNPERDMGCLKSIYEMSTRTHKLKRLLVRLLILITIIDINHDY